jgi:hypothetical protein
MIKTNFVPKGSKAWSPLGFIMIRPEFADDPQLIAHEHCHVLQFWKSGGTFPIRYALDKTYRLKCEIEAYKVSIAAGELLTDAATYLMQYKEGLTHAEAMQLLEVKS